MQPEKLKKLISEMSLIEKIGELFQLPSFFFDVSNATGPAQEMGITSEDIRVAGSCLSITGAKRIRELQREHMDNHPHHIPMLFMADIINGYHTIFPIPLSQGCTFDPDLVFRCAEIAAKEASCAGIHVTFSPMADLVRDARWGRVMESTGEDTYLNGLLAAAMVSGYQGPANDLAQKGKLAACLKHFAGYGAPLGGRDYNTVELSERTLREDYLPAYKAAIQAGAALVMTSFNTLDRIPSSGNRHLMKNILRGEMGFSGVVISDWAAIAELIPHGIAADSQQAALLAMEAGVDIDMASPVYIKNLEDLIEDGQVSEDMLDEAVLRVLTLKNRLGLFENPYKDADEEDERQFLLCENHRQIALECAEKSFVLLKNEDDFLPLEKAGETIAFIGPFTDSRLISGSWSFFGDDACCVSLKSGVLNNYPACQAAFAPGCTISDPGTDILGFQKEPPKENIDMKQAMTQALSLAKTADKVILALGEHREYTGEGASRADITLPSCQLELLRQINAVNPNIGIVLFNGRPLDLREVDKMAKSILEVWLPGTEGGNAIAHVLFGDKIPSGKLSMSFPYCVGQVPVYYNHLNTGRPFSGDYRKSRFGSKYLDIPNEPFYPFGYGLSYTSFSCSEVSLDTSTLTPDKPIHAFVTITNTGKRTGTETIQMYIRDLAGSVARPVRELKGFRKVTLAPGQTAEISFCIQEDMLRFYGIHNEYASEPGEFEVYIGTDSSTCNKANFYLKS